MNESIDRLAVAIDLAGTQSKQRAEMHSRLDVNDSRSTTAQVISPPPVAGAAVLPTSSLCTTTSMPIPTTGEKLTVFLNTTKSMEHVHKTADSAKMWDRPSFVGAAATLMQGLNAQCKYTIVSRKIYNFLVIFFIYIACYTLIFNVIYASIFSCISYIVILKLQL